MWEDSRGTVDAVSRGVAHHERSKDRRDEHSSQQSPGGSHLPGWLLPAGAAVVVLALIGGGVAVAARSGGGSSSGTSGRADRGSGGSGKTVGLAGGFTFTGSATLDGTAGTMTVDVTCRTVCTAKVTGATGFDDYEVKMLHAAVDHEYQGSSRSGTVQGTPVTACAEAKVLDAAIDPIRWTSSLTASEKSVSIEAQEPGYDLREKVADGVNYCSSGKGSLTYTGTPAT